MTRVTAFVDRVVVFILGALLVSGGLAAVSWSNGIIDGGRALRLSGLVSFAGGTWWPWAIGGAGVVVVLVAVWWLTRHRRTPGLRRVRLGDRALNDGSEVGVLSADASSVASAAAELLGQESLVFKAGSRASIERGVPTLTLRITVPARHGLGPAAELADRTAETAAVMLGDTVAIRTRIHVDAGRAPRPL